MKYLGIFDNETKKNIKRENNFKEFLEKGGRFYITLPEIIEVPVDKSFDKLSATFAFGLIGYAATSNEETESQYRRIETTVKPVEKGLYIHNATMEGEDMKIPWDHILNVTTEVKNPEKKGKYGDINLHFVDGKILKLNPIYGYNKLLFDFLNDRACGKIEDGWDTPVTETNNDNHLANIFCSSCGKELKVDDKFCSGCGNQI